MFFDTICVGSMYWSAHFERVCLCCCLPPYLVRTLLTELRTWTCPAACALHFGALSLLCVPCVAADTRARLENEFITNENVFDYSMSTVCVRRVGRRWLEAAANARHATTHSKTVDCHFNCDHTNDNRQWNTVRMVRRPKRMCFNLCAFNNRYNKDPYHIWGTRAQTLANNFTSPVAQFSHKLTINKHKNATRNQFLCSNNQQHAPAKKNTKRKHDLGREYN